MTIDKPEKENNNSRQHRDFGKHNIYMPKNINNIYAGDNNNYENENKFRFKNSLIITPNYDEHAIIGTIQSTTP